METPAADEVDAAMCLLDQDDEGAPDQPATVQHTAEQLTTGLNRMLSNMAKFAPPPSYQPPPPWPNTVTDSPLLTLALGQPDTMQLGSQC